jgi:hypothetical protein
MEQRRHRRFVFIQLMILAMQHHIFTPQHAMFIQRPAALF